MSSLRDQLLKAGLVDEKQVKKAQSQKKKEARLQHKGQLSQENDQTNSLQASQAEKIARDQELNRKQQEKAEKKAKAAQIKELIVKNKLPRLDTEDYYNFVDHKKVKRLAVNDLIRSKLTKGSLAIVSFEGYYEIVPRDVALKIKERHAERVIVLNDTSAESNEDDLYKDYVIPDDLMW